MSVLKATKGDDFSARFTLSDEAGAINLTGFTVTAQVRWPGGSVNATVINDDLPAGKIIVQMDEAQTEQIPLGRVAHMKFRWVSSGGYSDSVRIDVEVA
jgi:hypothetical protein